MWTWVAFAIRLAATDKEARKAVIWLRNRAWVSAIEQARAYGYRDGYRAGGTDGYMKGVAKRET